MAAPAHYHVAEGLLAGAYPGSRDAIEALEDVGVTVFVDLTYSVDARDGYVRFLRRSSRVWHPIPDFGAPEPEEMTRILDDVDAARAAGGSVYVHCWGGVGRTGTVIGCWLVRHGLDRGDAVVTLAALRRTVAGARRSPETPAQVALVQGWGRGR